MLGIKGVPPHVRGNKILPHHVHGIHAITIGSLVEQDKPLIWRGPMAHGAFKQLLLDNTEWPELDYLDRRPAAGHRRRAADAVPAPAADRRGGRRDAAAGGAGRRDPGGADVPAARRADPRAGREHELLRRRRRRRARHLRPRRHRAGRASGWACRSSARSRCSPSCASTATPATRPPTSRATRSCAMRWKQSCRRSPARSASGTCGPRARADDHLTRSHECASARVDPSREAPCTRVSTRAGIRVEVTA